MNDRNNVFDGPSPPFLKRAFFFAAVFCLASAGGAFGIDINMDTYRDDEGYYVSDGSLDFRQSFTTVQSVLLDFERYNVWATRGQDGKDPASAKFTGFLTGVGYDRPADVLSIIYDVNLFWPFGSKDNNARFKIDIARSPAAGQDRRCSIGFRFMDWSIAFENALLNFTLLEKPDRGCRLDFQLKVKLAWFLLPFFPIDSYKKHVANRVVLMMSSLSSYINAAY